VVLLSCALLNYAVNCQLCRRRSLEVEKSFDAPASLTVSSWFGGIIVVNISALPADSI